MKTIALTGSIGTGKSTVLAMFADLGIPTASADDIVHGLLAEQGAAVGEIARLFPQALEGSSINRKTLGETVFADGEKLKALEAILHPLVRKAEEAFLEKANRGGAKLAVIEIPLLFETNGEDRFDVVATTYAPDCIKWHRVKTRPYMTRQKFEQILARQTPDKIKRAYSHFTLHTWLGKRLTKWQIKKMTASF